MADNPESRKEEEQEALSRRIDESLKKTRERFNKMIPANVEISEAHLDFLKRHFMPANPETLAQKKYVEELKTYSEEKLTTHLIECAIRSMVNKIVREDVIRLQQQARQEKVQHGRSASTAEEDQANMT